MLNRIIPGPALNAAVKSNLIDGYERAYVDNAAISALVMDVSPSDKKQEEHVYRESAPQPRRQEQGDTVPYGSSKYVSYNIVNKRYTVGLQIHEDDLADDQSGSLSTEADRVGDEMAQLDERIAFQMLLNATDPALLPSVPNAPDGAALFSATDGGGADRFGVSGGNIVTGTACSTAAECRAQIFSGIMRMAQFLNTNGQQMNPWTALKSLAIIVSVTKLDLYLEALKQELGSGKAVEGSTTDDALSSLWRQTKFTPLLIPTTRVTTATSIFIQALGTKYRPIQRQQREALKVTPHPDNAGETFEDGFLRWKASKRYGWGAGLPVNLVTCTA